MRPLVRRVGRLQRLAVFEAAARRGTFTAAADELGMTQPAVTRHVRALEAELGVALFDRTANRATLTTDGERLREATASGFTAIEVALERLGAPASEFVLASIPGVAQRWLVPHLDGLQAALGDDADLRLWLFDRDAEMSGGGFDAAIHAGDGQWTGMESTPLFPEVVFPVATPAVAADLGLDGASPAADLPHDALLHLDDVDRPWMAWADWFAHHDLEAPPRTGQVVFNNYALVVQEAMAGHGVALGWRHLVDDLVDRGILVVVGPEVHHPTTGYHLLWPQGGRTPAVDRLAAWLAALIDG